jgi:hypothetical protein
VFQYNLDAFEAVHSACVKDVPATSVAHPGKPCPRLLLLACTSLVSPAHALHDAETQLRFAEAQQSGFALLGSTDLCEVSNLHLERPRVWFLPVPQSASAMADRIRWMWHAASLNAKVDPSSRCSEAVDLMVEQVAPDGEFDPETLAEELLDLGRAHPQLVAALFQNDVADVPDMIDGADAAGPEEERLIQAAAWMIVCWGSFENQREACLGWRHKHVPLDGVWKQSKASPFTIGQIFGPQFQQARFARDIKTIFDSNHASGVKREKDKRTINKVKRGLKKFGLGGVCRMKEEDLVASFGAGRATNLTMELEQRAAAADTYLSEYTVMRTTPEGKSRAGKHADALHARIPCTERLAIVVARTCQLGELARRAESTDDLRHMLGSQSPEILRPLTDKSECREKFRMRQLFHVLRVEFLRDGEQWPKAVKQSSGGSAILPTFDLSPAEQQRGHEIFDRSWRALRSQPSDWRFISPFGWQCDGPPRFPLSKPT